MGGTVLFSDESQFEFHQKFSPHSYTKIFWMKSRFEFHLEPFQIKVWSRYWMKSKFRLEITRVLKIVTILILLRDCL